MLVKCILVKRMLVKHTLVKLSIDEMDLILRGYTVFNS